MNIVVLRGTLSSEPRERTLPSGTNVLNWEVTTRGDGRPTRTVPVQWDDPPAPALDFDQGDEVLLLGEVRRRFFRAGGATASRTEVVAERAVRPTRKAAVTKLLAGVEQSLDPGLPA